MDFVGIGIGIGRKICRYRAVGPIVYVRVVVRLARLSKTKRDSPSVQSVRPVRPSVRSLPHSLHCCRRCGLMPLCRKIYQYVIEKERRGDYLGKTVQVRSRCCDYSSSLPPFTSKALLLLSYPFGVVPVRFTLSQGLIGCIVRKSRVSHIMFCKFCFGKTNCIDR